MAQEERMIEQIVREVLQEMQGSSAQSAPGAGRSAGGQGLQADRDYPLGSKRPDLIRTPTGKTLDDLTLENVMNGNISAQDVRIRAETLELQAQVAEQAGRPQLAQNFRRAAEMTAVPDERLLEMYNALRPYRSTRAELNAIADELEKEYKASITAGLVREAGEVYERRNRLRQD